MTIPEDELERIDKFAAAHGMTRSGFLLHAAKKALRLAEIAEGRGLVGAETPANSAKSDAREADPLQELSEMAEFSHFGVPADRTPEDPQADDLLETMRELENKLRLRSGRSR
jgi:hypothetical protein